MHIQKFSDEAMREARQAYYNTRVTNHPELQREDWQAAFRILLADVNAQLIAQPPAIAPWVSDEELGRRYWNALREFGLLGPEVRGATIRKVLSELAPQPALPSTEQASLAVPEVRQAMGEDAPGREASPAGERPAPDATMQRVAEVLTRKLVFIETLRPPSYDRVFSDGMRAAVRHISVDLGLEIRPAQPIRVVVKGEER